MISSDLRVAPQAVPPGGALSYEGSLHSTSAALLVPGIIGVANDGAGALTVTGAEVAVEYFDDAAGAWFSLGSTAGGGAQADTRPIATAGASYPAGGGPAGTTIIPGGLAAWSEAVRLTLAPDMVALVMNKAAVSAMRATVTFTSTGGRSRPFSRFQHNLIDAVRLAGAAATDAAVTLTPGVRPPSSMWPPYPAWRPSRPGRQWRSRQPPPSPRPHPGVPPSRPTPTSPASPSTTGSRSSAPSTPRRRAGSAPSSPRSRWRQPSKPCPWCGSTWSVRQPSPPARR